mmetsp:Transcript_1958/g.5888  ORF Transcript_1958/g.5888 Transcript_1958/m.5888 type:complete len:240 (+) Transcript_1958:1431-2150(+)
MTRLMQEITLDGTASCVFSTNLSRSFWRTIFLFLLSPSVHQGDPKVIFAREFLSICCPRSRRLIILDQIADLLRRELLVGKPQDRMLPRPILDICITNKVSSRDLQVLAAAAAGAAVLPRGRRGSFLSHPLDHQQVLICQHPIVSMRGLNAQPPDDPLAIEGERVARQACLVLLQSLREHRQLLQVRVLGDFEAFASQPCLDPVVDLAQVLLDRHQPGVGLCMELRALRPHHVHGALIM